MKKLLAILALLLLPAFAYAQLTTQQGGTGTTSPSGILYGDGTLHLKTLGIGANCTFTGGVFNCSGGGSSSFGTTSLSAVAPLQYSQSPLAQFSITQAGTGGNGYLSSVDFNTFNNKISSTSLSVTTTGTSGAATYTPATGVFNIPQYATAPGGLNLHVQYNNAGSFGGISGAVTDGTILNLTNPLLGGATLTTSVVNGVTLTAAGSATTYLNGTGGYSVPVGTVYTGTFPIQVTGSVISSLFSTTTNSGMAQGNLYVGSGGIFQTSASSSIFGFTPVAPTRAINTTYPLQGGGDLSADRTLTFGGLGTTSPWTQGQLAYVVNGNTLTSTATTSVTCTGNATCTTFTALGASPITINVAAGTAASSTLLGDSNTFSGVLNTFSNTIKVSSLSGFIGGNSGSLYGFATSTIKTSQLTNDAGFLTSAVTAVTASYPLFSSGGNTPNITTAFGTTSTWGLGNNGFVITGPTGIPFVAASSTLSLPNIALQNSSVTINTSGPLGGGGAVSLGGSLTLTCTSCSTFSYPFTPATFGIGVSGTSTPLYPAGLVTGTSTIGSLVASSSITNQAVKSALVLNSASGLEGAYGGANCTSNQFLTAITATGGCTSAAVTGAFFGNVSANTVFANATGASANPSFVATSTFFGAPTPGSILAFLNGAWVGAATTTFSSGLAYLNGNVTNTGVTSNVAGTGISVSGATGAVTITNTGVTSIVAGTNITVSGATGAVTVNATGGSSFGYPFPVLGIGTTTGLMITGSTTIGNGTQGTGLTVSGGATTTLNMAVLQSMVIGTSTGALSSVNGNNGNLFLYNTNTAGASPALVMGGNTGGDTDFWIGRQNNNDAISNDSLQIGAGLVPGTSPVETWNYLGRMGHGSTTPFADFAIHANPNDLTANPILFAIGSSTSNSTTTLFSVSNIGTTTLGMFGACNTTNALTTDTSGNITCGAITGGASGAAYPFTPGTSNNVAVSATTTALQGNKTGLAIDVAAGGWYGVGGQTLAYATTTNLFTLFGLSAGGNIATTSTANLHGTAFGYQALSKMNASSFNNNAIGYQALLNLTSGSDNNAMGQGAGSAITTGLQNTSIGSNSGPASGASSNNVYIGYLAAGNASGNNNTVIGENAYGQGGSSGSDNIVIGSATSSAPGAGTGNQNILIGDNITLPSRSLNGQLDIGNLLFGTGLGQTGTNLVIGNIGIGTTSPFAVLSIFTGQSFTPKVASTLFAIGSSTAGTATTTLFSIDSKGHIITGGTAPTISSCGTTPTFVGPANDTNMTVNIGSGVVSSCTITYAQPYPPASTVGCSLGQIGGSFATSIEASSTPTTLVISGGTITSDRYYLHCEASQ